MDRPDTILIARIKTWKGFSWTTATAADVSAVESATDLDVVVNGRVCALYAVPAHLETIAYPAPTLARLGYGTCLWESSRLADVHAL